VGDERAISDIRELFAKEAEPVGSVPPPVGLQGMVSTAVKAVKGARPTQFVDKLGERLGFERTGVRLYEGRLRCAEPRSMPLAVLVGALSGALRTALH
jgi:hypothetical protein